MEEIVWLHGLEDVDRRELQTIQTRASAGPSTRCAATEPFDGIGSWTARAFCFCRHHQLDAAEVAPPAEARPRSAAEKVKKVHPATDTSAGLLATGEALGVGLVGALDATAAVLARVGRVRPPSFLAAPAWLVRTRERALPV